MVWDRADNGKDIKIKWEFRNDGKARKKEKVRQKGRISCRF